MIADSHIKKNYVPGNKKEIYPGAIELRIG